MSDPVFPNGFIFKKSHPNSPAFVKGKVSIKKEEFKEFLDKQEGDWINLDLKESREGKFYAQLDTFEPDSSKAKSAPKPVDLNEDVEDIDEDSLPF